MSNSWIGRCGWIIIESSSRRTASHNSSHGRDTVLTGASLVLDVRRWEYTDFGSAICALRGIKKASCPVHLNLTWWRKLDTSWSLDRSLDSESPQPNLWSQRFCRALLETFGYVRMDFSIGEYFLTLYLGCRKVEFAAIASIYKKSARSKWALGMSFRQPFLLDVHFRKGNAAELNAVRISRIVEIGSRNVAS